MTEGSIAKNIILFYIPLAIGGLFQQLYSFVDSVVVGRGIGAQALAAVGATSIVVWLTLGFAMGLTRGFCIHISQAYGKKDYHLVNRGFFVASVLSLIVGAMISIVGSLAIRDFLILMHTPGEILEQSLDCLLYTSKAKSCFKAGRILFKLDVADAFFTHADCHSKIRLL